MMELILQHYGKLIADCLIIAIETIGLVKFFDNFLFPKKDLELRSKCGLELIICCVCAFINGGFFPSVSVEITNLFLLSLSITQLAYDYVISGFRHLIDRIFKLKESE